MTTDEMIEVLQAFKNGKVIQGRRKGVSEWRDATAGPGGAWDFLTWDYRVKPEPPKPREWIAVPFEKGRHGGSIYELRPVSDAQHCFGTIHLREVLP